MKRTLTKQKTICFLLAAVVLAGCQKGQERLDGSGGLTAMIVNDETKTSYDNDGKFVWSEGDQVAIHYSDGSWTTYDVRPSDGHIPAVSTASRYRDFYAVYPAGAVDASAASGPLSVTLPSYYDVSEIIGGTSASLTKDYSPLPMVAINEEISSLLRFRHVGALLRVEFTDIPEGVRTVTVTFNKDITGTYTVVDPDSGAPKIQTEDPSTTNAGNTVEFFLGENIADGIVLNVPVPCGTYQSIEIKCFDANNNLLDSKALNEATVFARKHGKRIYFGAYIDVEVEDIIIIDAENEAFIKDVPIFRNKSNVSVFARVAVTANWQDNEGNIISGLTINPGRYNTDYWTQNTADGFWYFRDPVAPGAVTELDQDGWPIPWGGFQSIFNLPVWVNFSDAPEGWTAPEECHPVIDIAVQAIEAGSYGDGEYEAAWQNAFDSLEP